MRRRFRSSQRSSEFRRLVRCLCRRWRELSCEETPKHTAEALRPFRVLLDPQEPLNPFEG